MRRVLLTTLATVVGVIALLSFKTHGHPLATAAGGLPSLSASTPSTTTPSTGTPGATTSSGAPPDPSRSTPSSTPSEASATYVGSSVDTRYGVVQVKVTISAHKITDVAFVQLTAFDGRSQQINSQAAPILLEETLNAQSAQIDSVSGASYTSQGYEQSLQSALDRAGF